MFTLFFLINISYIFESSFRFTAPILVTLVTYKNSNGKYKTKFYRDNFRNLLVFPDPVV